MLKPTIHNSTATHHATHHHHHTKHHKQEKITLFFVAKVIFGVAILGACFCVAYIYYKSLDENSFLQLSDVLSAWYVGYPESTPDVCYELPAELEESGVLDSLPKTCPSGFGQNRYYIKVADAWDSGNICKIHGCDPIFTERCHKDKIVNQLNPCGTPSRELNNEWTQEDGEDGVKTKVNCYIAFPDLDKLSLDENTKERLEETKAFDSETSGVFNDQKYI